MTTARVQVIINEKEYGFNRIGQAKQWAKQVFNNAVSRCNVRITERKTYPYAFSNGRYQLNVLVEHWSK